MTNKYKILRVSREFYDFQQNINQQIGRDFGGKITSYRLSKDLVDFINKENLMPVMIRRAKRNSMRRNGGMFS